MTSIALRAGSTRLAVAARADVLALATLATLVAILSAATWGTWGDIDSDTGYDVQAGERIADGQIPYRDFLYYYGPLAPALNGLAAFLGGSGFAPAIALGFAIALATIAATYAVARIVVGPLGALIAAVITTAVAFIPDDYNYVLPHTGDATVGTLLLLALLLVLHSYAKRANSPRALTVGTLLGLLALTKLEPAVAGFVALAGWLLVRRRTGLARRRELVEIGLPAIAIPAIVYGTFLMAVSPGRLFFENLYPRKFLAGNPLVKGRIPLTAESFVQLGAKLALYSLGLAALIVAARLLARGGRVRMLLTVAAGGGIVLATAASLARPEALRHGLQYAYGWIPAGVVLAAAILGSRLWRRHDAPTVRSQVELTGIVMLAVLAGTSYPGFFPHAPYEQIAAYSMPLAAVFLVGLHLRALPGGRYTSMLGALWLAFLAIAGVGLTLEDARLDAVTVRGPGGALAETRNEAALYQGALDRIARETRPGESIFVAPLMPGLYPLSDRRNPTDQLSALPGSLATVADEKATIATLEDAQVRLVITDDRTWHVYGQTSFGESFDRTLASWVESHFERVAVLRSDPWHSFEGNIPPRRLFVWLRRD